jgi:hypothetical protein
MQRTIIRLAGTGTVACLGLLGVAAVPAGATAQTGNVTGLTMDLGPPPVQVPANCPFGQNDDASFLMLSGNGVFHDSQNKNGDWGGSTIEGIAQFTVGTATYVGHLTMWGGGGNNAKGQNEGGQTMTFHGTGPDGTLDVHVNGHGTTSASGNQVGNQLNGTITCS